MKTVFCVFVFLAQSITADKSWPIIQPTCQAIRLSFLKSYWKRKLWKGKHNFFLL